MRAIISKYIPHGLRPQVSSRLGNQVPKTGACWTDRCQSARFDTGNLRHAQHTNYPWACVERSCAHIYLHAAADFRIKDRTVLEGQDLPKTLAREPRTPKTVLGTAFVGTRVFCRVLWYYHRRDDYALHRDAGRRPGETGRQFYNALGGGRSASARLCGETYRLKAVG